MTPSDRYVQINQDKCKGCELCIDHCPNDLLQIGDSLNSKGYYPINIQDQDYCINCFKCIIICPDNAFIAPQQKNLNLAGIVYWASKKIYSRVLKK